MQWIQFFLGTPRRLLATLAAGFVVVVLVEPSILAVLVGRFVAAVDPILGPVIQLIVIGFALRIMFRGLFGGGKKK